MEVVPLLSPEQRARLEKDGFTRVIVEMWFDVHGNDMMPFIYGCANKEEFFDLCEAGKGPVELTEKLKEEGRVEKFGDQ